jgi:hypothetical protein
VSAAKRLKKKAGGKAKKRRPTPKKQPGEFVDAAIETSQLLHAIYAKLNAVERELGTAVKLREHLAVQSAAVRRLIAEKELLLREQRPTEAPPPSGG